MKLEVVTVRDRENSLHRSQLGNRSVGVKVIDARDLTETLRDKSGLVRLLLDLVEWTLIIIQHAGQHLDLDL